MAYVEKVMSRAQTTRGNVTWRARHRRTDGTWAITSRFPTKRLALEWGLHKERTASQNSASQRVPEA